MDVRDWGRELMTSPIGKYLPAQLVNELLETADRTERLAGRPFEGKLLDSTIEVEAHLYLARILLRAWIDEGRFLVGNSPEKVMLVESTRALLAESGLGSWIKGVTDGLDPDHE